jgi:hypothetical protein
MDLRGTTRPPLVGKRRILCANLKAVIAGRVGAMTDSGEIEALKASMRGVRASAEALAALDARVEALDARADVSETDLEDLRRLTLAHAVAAQALRGLVQTMLKRRGKLVDEAVGGSSVGEE